MLQPRPDLVWTKVPLDIATFGLGFEIQIALDTIPSEFSDFDYTVFYESCQDGCQDGIKQIGPFVGHLWRCTRCLKSVSKVQSMSESPISSPLLNIAKKSVRVNAPRPRSKSLRTPNIQRYGCLSKHLFLLPVSDYQSNWRTRMRG